MPQRQLVVRVVLAALIVVCLLWCGRTGLKAYHMVTTLRARSEEHTSELQSL